MSSPQPVDPFALVVNGERATTLLEIALYTAVPLPDLRSWNPGLDTCKGRDKLPEGTVVRLQPLPGERGKPYGCSFSLGEAELAIHKLERRLDELLGGRKQDTIKLPARRVFSKMERIVSELRKEGERQLACIKKGSEECERDPRMLQFLVDVGPVEELEQRLNEEFDGLSVGLQVLKKSNEFLFQKEDRFPLKRCVEEDLFSSILDDAPHLPAEHSYQWEFTFLTPGSATQLQDTWAVLSSQRLDTLLDNFVCRNYLSERMSKNAFFFIGGAFYVDNRHADSEGEGYEDVTKYLRHHEPCKAVHDHGDKGESSNSSFGACPVYYISDTTFADLNLRLGEFGVLRHFGCCNHYFYLSAVTKLYRENHNRYEGASFPRRIMKSVTRVVRCRMCHSHPATIVCYNDALSPESPCHYCVPCYELLNASDDGISDGLKAFVIRLPKGKCVEM
uniref:Putative small nuclear RNA gene activation protein (SNAP) 50 n=1 Tax=Trypanosoma congolense (strain IL3000) TaxID=1068625 RepID=G0UUA2_TRYCI|nr:putative small nuclear RNA gene activation protein (SNAP) 50 [Trypanosoma congolense IL3000]